MYTIHIYDTHIYSNKTCIKYIYAHINVTDKPSVVHYNSY